MSFHDCFPSFELRGSVRLLCLNEATQVMLIHQVVSEGMEGTRCEPEILSFNLYYRHLSLM